MNRDNFPSELPDHGPAYLPRAHHWVFRRGMYLLAMGLLVLVLCAGMVPYPSQLSATVILRSDHPIAHIHAKFAGELEEVRVQVGDTVEKGQVLAVMKGLTPYTAIGEIKRTLGTRGGDRTLSDRDTERSVAVGPDLQLAYQRFIRAKQELDQLAHYQEKELSQDKWQWILAEAQQSVKEQELTVQKAETELQWAKKQWDRHRALYEKGVIAIQDLESLELHYRQSDQQEKQARMELARKRSELERLKVERSLGANTLDREQRNTETEWAMARQELDAQITDWEEQHLLTSPIDGRVSHSGVWGEHQNLVSGARAFSIEPLEPPKWFVECQVPLHNAGQLKVGQPLLIDLEHWPRRDFGALRGEILSISGIPFEGHYSALAMLRSNVTTYGKTIQLSPEMAGTAEIVIENRSVLGSLFQSLFHGMAPIQTPPGHD